MPAAFIGGAGSAIGKADRFIGGFSDPSTPVIVDLTAASLTFIAKAVQNSRTLSANAASLTFIAKAIQNRYTISANTASLTFIAKAVQNALTISLTSASFRFVAAALAIISTIAKARRARLRLSKARKLLKTRRY